MPRHAAETLRRSDWRRTLAAAVWTATTLMAAVIVSRRLGGHIAIGLHPLPTTLVVALLIGLNMAAAMLIQSTANGSSTQFGPRFASPLALYLVTFVPPFAMGVSLLPAGSVAGLSALTAVVLLCGVALLVAGADIRFPLSIDEHRHDLAVAFRPADAVGQRAATCELELAAALETDSPAPFDELSEMEADECADGDRNSLSLSQSMSRATESDGSETIEGTVVLRFDVGQQIGVVHLPFCPPLAGQPQVSCHLLEDRPVRLRVTATHSYGVRLEAKRIEATSGAEEIVVGYVISATATQARAA